MFIHLRLNSWKLFAKIQIQGDPLETRIPEKSKKNGKARNSNKKPYSIRPDKFKPQGIPNTELKFQSQNSIPTSQNSNSQTLSPSFLSP